MALSATFRVPARAPAAAGLKTTLMIQLEPAATVDPQPLVWVKSLELAPATEMLVTVKVALPLLVTVTD